MYITSKGPQLNGLSANPMSIVSRVNAHSFCSSSSGATRCTVCPVLQEVQNQLHTLQSEGYMLNL